MKMGNMRELSLDECRRVSGGTDIVVTGTRSAPGTPAPGEIVVTGREKYFEGMYGNYTQNQWYQAAMAGTYAAASGAGLSGSGATQGPEMVDTDGDGVLDSPIITVTAGVTHDQIKFLNEAAAWYQWGQNVAFGLVVGGGLMTTGLSAGREYAAGAAIGGAASVPPLGDAQYQANWNILYYNIQVDTLRGSSRNHITPGLNMY